MNNETGFHKESVDIFTCDEDHSMNSTHFIDWIEKAASYLLFLRSAIPRIAIIIIIIIIIIRQRFMAQRTRRRIKSPKHSWRNDHLQK